MLDDGLRAVSVADEKRPAGADDLRASACARSPWFIQQMTSLAAACRCVQWTAAGALLLEVSFSHFVTKFHASGVIV